MFVFRLYSIIISILITNTISCSQLLTTLLENNPFMGILNPELYRAKILELETYLKSNVPEEILKARDEAIEAAKKEKEEEAEEKGDEKDDDNNNELEIEKIEAAALAAAIADAEEKPSHV